MTGYELELAVASLFLRGVAAFAAVGSLIAIFRGLRQMDRATTERARREDARHAEAMRALDQQAETLRAVVKSMETQAEISRAVVRGMETQAETSGAIARGMETVIERTAPRR